MRSLVMLVALGGAACAGSSYQARQAEVHRERSQMAAAHGDYRRAAREQRKADEEQREADHWTGDQQPVGVPLQPAPAAPPIGSTPGWPSPGVPY